MSARGARPRRLLGALAVAAVPGGAAAANECNGIPRCIPVEGPWVTVPANGEVVFVLALPAGRRDRRRHRRARELARHPRDVRRRSSASPVAFGRTTHTPALFRAVSAHHQAGLVQAVHRLYPVARRRFGTRSRPRSRRSARRSTSWSGRVTLNAGLPADGHARRARPASRSSTAGTRPRSTRHGPPPPGLASAIRGAGHAGRGGAGAGWRSARVRRCRGRRRRRCRSA